MDKCINNIFGIDKLEKHFAKWNKPDTETQELHDLTYTWYVWNLKTLDPQR
jgi:hypothetical protein